MKSAVKLQVEIAAVGSYLPDRILTNHELEQMVDTSDEWITKRTGIKERHIAAPEQATSDLALAAGRVALERAGMDASEVEAIIIATSTPDYPFPATACLVQTALGAENAMCYDLEAACSGFLFGVTQGASMIAAGVARNALVIGAESLSRITDYTDRRSCILFGDGAGAVVLRPSTGGGEIVFFEVGADGSRPDILILTDGGSRKPFCEETLQTRSQFMRLEGREVFKLAVNKLGELLVRIPDETGISLDKIKVIIPHQSNERIIRSVCERAGIASEKAYLNIDRVGNTSAASVPIAMDELLEQGRIERGDLVLLLVFGGGLTWGSMLVRY